MINRIPRESRLQEEQGDMKLRKAKLGIPTASFDCYVNSCDECYIQKIGAKNEIICVWVKSRFVSCNTLFLNFIKLRNNLLIKDFFSITKHSYF